MHDDAAPTAPDGEAVPAADAAPAMSANVSAGWAWTRRTEQAALLVAEDDLSDTLIAARLGVTQRTLERWKLRRELRARVQEHRDTWRAEIRAKGIAERQNRVDALNDRHQRMQRVIEARAVEHAAVPGGDTGLYVRQTKLVKVYKSDDQAPADDATDADEGDEDDEAPGETLYSAKRDVLVYEYAVDTALLKEMREHEKQAAIERGEWAEKREVSGPGGDAVQVEVRARDYRDGLLPFLPPTDAA